MLAPTIESGLETVDFAHNASLFNAHTPVQRRWLLEEVVPRLQPRRVIWAVASLDFNGGRPQPEIEVYETSRAAKVGLAGPIDRFLSRVLTTVRYRQEVRGPLFFSHAFDPPTPDTPPEPIESLLERSQIWGREQTGEAFADLRRLELHDFHIGEREAADFVYTIEDMLDTGIEVVLVLMPVPEEYIAANDEGRIGFEAWSAWVVDTAGGLGVPAFDYSTAIEGVLVGDYTHLDAEGAAVLTEMLVEDLETLGW